MRYIFWAFVVWGWFNIILWSIFIGLRVLFSRIGTLVSFAGFSGIRTRKRECQTAVITYEHPKTKRRVVCVGMVHIAEPAYFQALQKIVDELHGGGYSILYEFILPPAEDELAALGDEEKNLVRKMPEARGAMESQAALLNLVYQKHALTYPPSWTRTDMSGLEFVGALSCLVGGSAAFGGLPQETPDGYQQLMTMKLNDMFKAFPFWCMLLNIVPLCGRPEQFRGLFIVRRNEIAIRAIRTHVAHGNVVTMWGAGHLWGIGKYLKRNGFEEIGREWIPVYHIRRYSWWQSKRLTARVYWSFLKKLWGPA